MTSVPTKAVGLSSLARAGIAARGLSRLDAATYVGVSVGLFDAMVEDGRMPRPKVINNRRVWDRVQLDTAFESLPDEKGSQHPGDGGAATTSDDDVWSRPRA